MAGKLRRKIRKYHQKYIWIRHAAGRGGVSVFEARRQMKEAREKYGISYENFAKKDYIRVRDPEERDRKIRKFIGWQESNIAKTADVTGWTYEHAAEEMGRVRKKYGISYYEYFFNQMYRMTDEEIAVWKKERREKRQEIISYVMKETGWSEGRVREHMSHCSGVYSILQSSYIANRCWELSEEQLSRMANDSDSIALSAKYNRNTDKLVDKALFDETYSEFVDRRHWVNEAGATYESFCDFARGMKRLFYKALNLSCGFGAGAVDVPQDEAGLRELYEWFMDKETLIVEECIEQHEKMAEMYDGSVNTIRLTNLQTPDGEVHHILSFVRFGTRPGVDNFKNGGIAAGVDIETGEVITDAKDNDGNVYAVHPVTGKTIRGFRIPMWDQVLDLVDRAIAADPDINYVGWDVAIRQDRPVLVEGNSKSQCSTYQALFDARTDGKKYTYERFL